MIKIGVIKTGHIASSSVIELLLDERAERNDIEIRVATSGAKMFPKECEEVANIILSLKPDLILYSTPNPSLPGPVKVVEKLSGKNAIVIGDTPGIKIKPKLEEEGLGYIFIRGDSMLGARREFLDPIEMALFNAEILKVLSVTGAFRVLHEEVDAAINALKEKKSYLPRIIVDRNTAIERSGIKNPYALAKAMSAYEMVEKVGELDIEGCFVEKHPEKYIQIAASAHELLRAASKLVDEVREIEKTEDQILRRPHYTDGKLLRKNKLFEKPS